MRTTRRALQTAVLAVVLAIGAGPSPALADHGGGIELTFLDVVDQSSLVVLARVRQRDDGGFTLTVERSLKGFAEGELDYAPTEGGPSMNGWDLAVVAFADPRTIDARAPTIAWRVAPDGRIDPEGLLTYPDTPSTLDALLALVGAEPFAMTPAQPASDPPPVAAPAADATSVVIGIGLAIVVLVAAAIAWAATRRDRSGGPATGG